MPQTRSFVDFRAKLEQHDHFKNLCIWPADSGSVHVHVSLPADKLCAFVQIMFEATSLVDKVICVELLCYLDQRQFVEVLQCVYNHSSGQQIMADWFTPARDVYADSPNLLYGLLDVCVSIQQYEGAFPGLRAEVQKIEKKPSSETVKRRVRGLLANWSGGSPSLQSPG